MALSPTSSRPSGGSSYTPPTARQSLTGNAVTIANGGNDSLTWNTSFGPSVLLDRSDPTTPAVLTAGIYAVMLLVVPGSLTAGGGYQVQLELDRDDTDATVTMDSATATAGVATPNVSLACTWYIPAAGTIRVTVRNHDGASSVAFALNGMVQKIT